MRCSIFQSLAVVSISMLRNILAQQMPPLLSESVSQHRASTDEDPFACAQIKLPAGYHGTIEILATQGESSLQPYRAKRLLLCELYGDNECHPWYDVNVENFMTYGGMMMEGCADAVNPADDFSVRLKTYIDLKPGGIANQAIFDVKRNDDPATHVSVRSIAMASYEDINAEVSITDFFGRPFKLEPQQEMIACATDFAQRTETSCNVLYGSDGYTVPVPAGMYHKVRVEKGKTSFVVTIRLLAQAHLHV